MYGDYMGTQGLSYEYNHERHKRQEQTTIELTFYEKILAHHCVSISLKDNNDIEAFIATIDSTNESISKKSKSNSPKFASSPALYVGCICRKLMVINVNGCADIPP
ncbi:hypothetical protein Bhyg_17043, partial [Pseudolycoriella hygida]